MGEHRASSSSAAAGRRAGRRRTTEERPQQPELGLLNRLALAIAEPPDFDAALDMVLTEVGQATGWDCGQAWAPTSDGTGLACRPVWYGDRKAFGRFRSVSEGTVFAPGVGLPGRAWANRRPAWLRDLAADTNFPRGPVAKAVGLRTGMAIPVLAGREVVAVLEFFVVEERPEDEELVTFISAIGALLGSALARRRAEEALRESQERFRSVVQSAIDAVVLADTAGTIMGWNAAAERMFGYTEPEALGRPLTLLMPERFHEAHQTGLGRLARGGPPTVLGTVLELFGRRQDGTEFPLELSLSTWSMAGAACFSGILRDITERKRAEEALAQDSFRDSLTGLPNPSLLFDRLGVMLSRLARRPSVVAVLFIDIDNFKMVTDSLGHVGGDRLLVQAAERLTTVTRMADTLARFGGQFVLLCDGLEDRGQAALLAARIRALTKVPFVVDGRKVLLSVSVRIRFAEAPDRWPGWLLPD
jgi:PAS domain S-box-containing protein/diguanylate cyclase (GGDEF)-like protein